MKFRFQKVARQLVLSTLSVHLGVSPTARAQLTIRLWYCGTGVPGTGVQYSTTCIHNTFGYSFSLLITDLLHRHGSLSIVEGNLHFKSSRSEGPTKVKHEAAWN